MLDFHLAPRQGDSQRIPGLRGQTAKTENAGVASKS